MCVDLQDDGSLRSWRSLDESISSLQTFVNKDFRVLDSRQNKSSTVTREDFNQIIHNISDDGPSSIDRGTNTLGMFAHGKKHKQVENEQESMMSELVSEVESKGDAQIPSAQFLHKAHDNKEKFQAFENEEVEPLRELSTHLNFKKPPISVDGSVKSKHLSGKKESVSIDVLSGKKGSLPSSVPFTPMLATRNDSINSETENSVPTSIAVRPPANESITAVANGHTLLCKPLTVQQSKIYPQETVSNLSGGTFSSNDENEMVYDSHAQMRKMPPLTDDSDDEESVACEQDKYQTIEPNISEDNSLSKDKNSVPIVDAKRSTYRRSGLAAFRPTKSYDTISTAGSSVSEATTAVTGHTRKSISFLRDPRRSRSNANKVGSTGTKRFAAMKARVRVRKV